MKKTFRRISLLVVLAIVTSIFTNITYAQAASAWSFICGSGKKIEVNDTVTLQKNEYQDLNIYKSGKEIKIAPLSVYAILKEVHSIRRFQMLVYPENKVRLRIEEKDGVSKEAAFRDAKARLEEFLKTQNITDVTILLSEEVPKQNPNSGKFKHVINVKKQDWDETSG